MENKIIYWIGGSACAGKSTLANMIADKYKMDLYSCDEHFYEHLSNISAINYPAMYKVSKMNANEAFYLRDIEEQLSVYTQSFIEDFQFVMNDILNTHTSSIVVEGNQLLPSLVFPYLRKKQNAVWIIPTESFQKNHYKKREWLKDILESTDDPTVSFDNWMKRDALFAKYIYHEAKKLKLQTLLVDGSNNIDENFNYIERIFGLK
ncbi:hypothetical protein [Gottfriedia solisilvae]|uniref:hypothetical protein n=1 Tax=Gottfriedia solisilvae TaxID=1516104 RepID=UPI003D2EF576